MPAGYESGLRVVEHYLGRASASKQDRGIFPSLTSAPTITVGRNVRVRDGVLTGIAAIPESAVSVHGVRPTYSVQMDGIAEDMVPFLMSFFHNSNYTVLAAGAGTPTFTTPFTEVGQFEFGMLDSRPDHTGAIVGTYDPAAGTYGELVTMSDAYTIGLEWLYGHGDLGDTDNGISIDNCITNKLMFECSRGADSVLQITADGFGRTANELADYVAATWGPGINGSLTTQKVFAPDTFSLAALTINAGDVVATFTDWMDSVSVEMTNGINGRDNLGSDEFGSLLTDGRPSVTATLGMSYVDPGFLTAMVNNQKIVCTLRFSNGANETLDIVLPNMRVTEEFAANSGDASSDIDVQIPLVGVVDVGVASPLVEVDLKTVFDVRTNSHFRDSTLALASAYTA